MASCEGARWVVYMNSQVSLILAANTGHVNKVSQSTSHQSGMFFRRFTAKYKISCVLAG